MQENLKREDSMSLEGFCAYIRLGIQQRMGQAYHVATQNYVKNNGVTLPGLTVMREESNLSPTIYLNGFYENYVRGAKSLEQCEVEIMETYRRNKTDHNVDISFFTEWENARQRIIYKIVNYEANRELLKDVPHRRILDLAMVYSCLVENGITGSATILIHNQHLKLWGTGEEELFHTAMENTPYFQKEKLTAMDSVIEYLTGKKVDDVIEDCSANMYVLTVEDNLNGAGAILYPDVLKGIAEKMRCKNFFIIPSSIHETIIVPMLFSEKDFEALSQMVKEVNATQLAPEEILSDHAYVYRRADNTISMQGQSFCLSDLWQSRRNDI